MAYDLVFKTQTPRMFARGEGVAPKIAGGVGLLVAASMLLIPRLRRRSEIQKCRVEYAHDYVAGKPARRLNRTMEMPVVPMAELVRQPVGLE